MKETDLKKEARLEVGEILADFENDHDEVKAVKNIFEEIDKAILSERKRLSDIVLPKAKKFIAKVERGRAVSVETYADMKEIVEAIEKDV